MTKKRIVQNVLSSLRENELELEGENSTEIIPSIKVHPPSDSPFFKQVFNLANLFSDRIIYLIKESITDQIDSTRKIFNLNDRVVELYVDLLARITLYDVMCEMFYLINMIVKHRLGKVIEGFLVTFDPKQGIILNEDQLKSHISRKRIISDVFIKVLKKNNWKWLEEYIKLNRETELFKASSTNKYIEDISHYYIGAALRLKKEFNAVNKEVNFTIYSRQLGEKRTTLISRLQRLNVYEKILGILKSDD